MKMKEFTAISSPPTTNTSWCIVGVKTSMGIKIKPACFLPTNNYTSGRFVEAKVGGDAYSSKQTDITEDVIYYYVLPQNVDTPEIL